MKRPISQRTDYHRLPTYNPDAQRRRRLAIFFLTSSYLAAFLLGVLTYALIS